MLYWPSAHCTHATVAVGLNWPPGHASHVLAPGAVSVLVAQPLLQREQLLTDKPETGSTPMLYWPGAHCTHATEEL